LPWFDKLTTSGKYQSQHEPANTVCTGPVESGGESAAGQRASSPRDWAASPCQDRHPGEGRNPEKRWLDPGLRRDDGLGIKPIEVTGRLSIHRWRAVYQAKCNPVG